MPRASRYLVEGYTSHLTHRCHDRRFLLKFKKERDAYREWLRVGVKRHGLSVYGYCITSNHIHVVAHVDDREAVARVMQLPSGVVAKALNKRKRHEDSVWEHPYHCTMIEDGHHLLRCLRYVDLNMVRAGVVKHPREWHWCSYDERTGQRQRYRIVDLERLVQRLALPDADSLFRLHDHGIRDQLQRRELSRQEHWTEALAVGSQGFITKAESLHRRRRQFTRYSVGTESAPETWAVRETRPDYDADSNAESAF
jgi:putative transposase